MLTPVEAVRLEGLYVAPCLFTLHAPANQWVPGQCGNDRKDPAANQFRLGRSGSHTDALTYGHPRITVLALPGHRGAGRKC